MSKNEIIRSETLWIETIRALDHLASSLTRLAEVFEPHKVWTSSSAPPVAQGPTFLDLFRRAVEALERSLEGNGVEL